jgi:hypothetical protein
MSTATAAFPLTPVHRAHAPRFADGVVAGYIHALAGAARASAPTDAVRVSAMAEPAEVAGYAAESAADAVYATSPAEVVAIAIEVNRAPSPRHADRPRGSACRNRGARVARAMREQRVIGAR